MRLPEKDPGALNALQRRLPETLHARICVSTRAILGRSYLATVPQRLITRNQIAAINSAASTLLNSVYSINISSQPRRYLR